MCFPPDMNIKNVASHVANAYQIDVRRPEQLQPIERISRATLDAAFSAADDFREACGRQFNLLLNFLRALEGGNAAEKLLSLRQINLAFGCHASVLPNQVPLDQWAALGAACSGLTALARPYMAQFYQSRNPGTALRDIEAIFHTANANPVGQGTQALEVMRVVMKRNGDPSGITSRTIMALVKMLIREHRPMSGFMGFSQWGPGDNGDPVANLDAHVLKHICRQPIDVNFGVSETMAWWDVLRVRLTREDYDRLAVNPKPQSRICFDNVQPLKGDRLKKFLVYHSFQNQVPLTQFVKNQALNGYRDFAIENSRVMSNVLVHSNGTRVFISGSAGGAFIIGRFEGEQLGISSCYRPLDLEAKLRGARANMCWPLR